VSHPPAEPGLPLLLNPSAGRGVGRWNPALRTALAEADVPALVREVDPRRLESSARRLAAAGAPVVAVGGGDGSVRAAAEALAGTGTALAVIPLGTLNHFANRIGVGGVRAAVAAVRAGRQGSATAGILDDRVFLCTATIGFYADAVRRRERLRPAWGRLLAVVVGIAAGLRGLPAFRVGLETAGGRHECTTPLVWVGIVPPRRGGGSELEVVVPRRWSGSELEVVVPRRWSGWRAPVTAARLLLRWLRGGRVVDDPALRVVRARHVVVHGTGTVGVTLDGEAFTAELPVWLAVQDGAVRVVVPTSRPAAPRRADAAGAASPRGREP
jgi:diacylglycerol kinase family enzyme